MKQTLEFDKSPKTEKIRSEKRTYTKRAIEHLGRFELAFLSIATENAYLLETAASGSLPLVMGAFMHSISLDRSPAGRVRKRFLSQILTNLESAGKIKVEFNTLRKNPIGLGTLKLI